MATQNIHLQRRHDLDWLRVLAFGLLIFYHIGMLYVEHWDFHIKSSYQSTFLENIMLLINRWRLPILFLISGLSIRFILAKISIIDFITKRSLRLLLPLAFGVIVIVPPQLYCEMTHNGDLNISYWEFYQAFFVIDHPLFKDYQAGILPHMDVNHLWYIRELWTFSIYLILLIPILNSNFIKNKIDWLANKGKRLGIILIPITILTILELAVFPGGEGHRKALGFTFLIIGYLIGWHETLWKQIKRSRRVTLRIALASYTAVIIYYNHIYLNSITELPFWGQIIKALIGTLNTWCWILAILGYGAKYLNKPSKTLHYLNEAVYPYYILHQTIIIIVAFELSKRSIGPFFEPTIIILATFTGCTLGFEIIRRNNLLRPLHGLNKKDKANVKYTHIKKSIHYALATLSAILLIPLGYIILF